MKQYRFHSEETNNVRVSVLGEYDKENSVLKLTASRCSEKDNFDKRRGNLITTGRMKAGKLYDRMPLEEEPTNKDFIGLCAYITRQVSRYPDKVVNVIQKV